MWNEGYRDQRDGDDEPGRSSINSEVVVMDDAVAAVSSGVPTVSNLNISKSSRVHIGPKFVSVTQNVNNTEMIKDLPLPQYLWNVVKNTTRAERLSCAVALVALLICTTLIVYFTVKAKSSSTKLPDKAPHEWNITREMWLGSTSLNLTAIDDQYVPMKLIVVQHTASTECRSFALCAAEVRNLERYFLNMDPPAYLPYSFMIGNEGRVYEARGWGIRGAHTLGYNQCSLGVGFIGDYRREKNLHARVTQLQMERFQLLIDEGVKYGYIDRNYRIAGAKDLTPTESPGSDLYEALYAMDHYDRGHLFVNKTCEDIKNTVLTPITTRDNVTVNN